MKYKQYFDNSVLLDKYVSLTNEEITIPTRYPNSIKKSSTVLKKKVQKF